MRVKNYALTALLLMIATVVRGQSLADYQYSTGNDGSRGPVGGRCRLVVVGFDAACWRTAIGHIYGSCHRARRHYCAQTCQEISSTSLSCEKNILFLTAEK